MGKRGKQTVKWFAVSMLVVSAAGCYGDIRDYCEEAVSCIGGNGNDEDACVETQKGARKIAKEYDCKDEFDKVMECYADDIRCETSQIILDSEKCAELAGKLATCEDKGSAL